MSQKLVTIYTDGACTGNRGPGGYLRDPRGLRRIAANCLVDSVEPRTIEWS